MQILLKTLSRILFISIIILTPPCFASNKIVAVVDSDIITDNDLTQRYEMLLASGKIDNQNYDVKSVKLQILQGLISEKIFVQEAKKIGITADDGEVLQAIERIEQNQSLYKGQLLQELSGKSVKKEAVMDQIRNSIIWEKLLVELIAPRVEVTDDELFEFIENDNSSKVKIDAYVISVDNKDSSSKLKKFWDQAKDCKWFNEVKGNLDKEIRQDNIKTNLNNINNKDLRRIIAHTKTGSKSDIFESKDKAQFLMVCDKAYNMQDAELENLKYNLKLKKASTQAQYYMSNIKKKKFIKVYL